MIRSPIFYWQRRLIFFIIFFLNACILSYAQESTDNHFYFVQMTDTHFGDKNHFKKAKKAIKQINKLPMKIEFVVLTGDITMQGLEDKEVVHDSLEVFEKLKAPVYYVPGNNDIIPEKLDTTSRKYLENFGPLISMAEYQGVVCLFVYTEPLRKAFSMNGYDPLKQVEQYLGQSKGKPALIFHHAPCVSDFYDNRFHDKWDEHNKKKWIALVNRYNVKAVIAGHFHRDELHWLGNVPLYVAPPISGYFGRQSSFRIYEYANGKISYSTQYFD